MLDFKNILSQMGDKEEEKKPASELPFCPYRREHLYRDEEDKKNPIKKKNYCKDSSIVYHLGRKIFLTLIEADECKSCDVKNMEHLIDCSKLGFFKLRYEGKLFTVFVCKDKGRLSKPAQECAECKKGKYIA